jgi:hypothetical protein
MKRLFQKFIRGTGPSAAPAGPRLALGAFGKHPGWDDHIPGIGIETETLASIKQTYYVSGIGSQIDSGVWEKLEPQKSIEGFSHTFLTFQPGHIVLGQLWSSVDRKGRSKYPMMLCVDGEGISAGFLVRELAPLLDQLREKCKATNSAEQVISECGAAQERLRARLGSNGVNAELPTLEERRRFLSHSELGPDRLGLLRVLHELRSAPAVAGNARGQQSGAGSRQFRVPLAADSRYEALLDWAAFFRGAIPNQVPLLLISRENTDWIDVIVGEPSAADFFCLRASLKALPLVTEIPYDLGSDIKAHLAQLEAKFLNPSAVPERATAGIAPKATLSPETGAAKSSGKLWMLVAAVVLIGVAVVAGGMWLSKGKPDSKAVTKPVGSNALVATSLTRPPPESPATNAAPSPTIDVAEQTRKYSGATNAARMALAQGEFQNAVDQAQMALKSKPDDAAATQLLGEARQGLALAAVADERHQKYVTATNAASVALKQGSYDEAIKQAGLALTIKPNDPAAGKLVAAARQAIANAADEAARTQKYLVASNAAAQALAAGNYEDTTNQAGMALVLRPGDATASRFMADAKQALDKKAEALKRQQYETAMNAAKLALQQGDNEAATRETDIAAGLEPGDTAAAKLKAQIVEAKDLASARTFFNEGDYDSAAKLCAAHPGVALSVQLADSIHSEQQELNEARQKFSSGDYSFIEPLQGQLYHGKRPFSELLSQASGEQKLLGELEARKQTNDWQTVKAKLAETASAKLADKPPFHTLNDWATAQSAVGTQKDTLVKLDTEFEKYLVWFNVLKPTDARIKTPEGRKAQRIDGELGDERETYLKQIAWLKNEYQKGGWLNQEDRQLYLDKLKEAILHRE